MLLTVPLKWSSGDAWALRQHLRRPTPHDLHFLSPKNPAAEHNPDSNYAYWAKLFIFSHENTNSDISGPSNDIASNNERAKCARESSQVQEYVRVNCVSACGERRTSCLHNLTSKSIAEEKCSATGVKVCSFRIWKDKSSIKHITDMTYLGLHQRGKIVSDSYKWSHNNSLSYFGSVPASVSQFVFRISGLN